MKKISSLIIIFLLIFLAGCGSLNISTQTNIDSKGAGDYIIKLTYNGIFKQGVSQNQKLLQNNSIFSIPNAQVTQYIEGDNVIEEAKVHFNNFEELNKVFKTNNPNQEFITAALNVKKGLIYNTYTYELKLPKTFSLSSLTAALAQDNNELFKPEDVASFLGSAITFSNTVNIPGKIISNNATKVEGNKLSWGYTLSQIDPGKPLTVSYQMLNVTNIIAGIIGLALLGIALAIFLNRRKRKILGAKAPEESDILSQVKEEEEREKTFDEGKEE